MSGLRIALLTEGTYPYHTGGVSVWCDQLVRGFPEHEFAVHAVVGTGDEKPSMPMPANVARVVPLPLWGAAGGRRRGRFAPAFGDVHDAFLARLLEPEPDPAGFASSLRGLFEYAQAADLGAALASDAALARLVAAWRGAGWRAQPSLADAIRATDLLEHLLRPLSARPPEADLCHPVAAGPGGLLALGALWRHGTPFVLSEHGVYLRERYLAYGHAPYSSPVKALLLRFFRLLSGALYREAALVAPVSEYNRRWELRLGASPDRVQPVHNGVDPAAFPPAPEPDAPTLSWVGRIDPLKDVPTLIRAFAEVRAEMPTARLRMFGPVPKGNEAYRDRCAALVKELGLTGAATFEGPIRPVVGAYHAGQVVVLTSISEAFPYTVIEAMMTGRATVSTDVGGVREAVGSAGLLVPPRDPRAVAKACLALLRHDTLRGAIAAAARTRALEHFTLERFYGTFRGVYSTVANQLPPELVLAEAAEPVAA